MAGLSLRIASLGMTPAARAEGRTDERICVIAGKDYIVGTY